MTSPSDLRRAASDVMRAPSYLERSDIASVLEKAADQWEKDLEDLERLQHNPSLL